MDPNYSPKKQNIFFWLAAVGFLLLRFLPDVLIWLSLPAGKVFNGSFVNIDDTGVYLSAIRQGAEGAWLFTPQFSQEGLPAHLSYMPFLLAGKFQALLGGSGLLWFYILSLISTGFALYALFKLTRNVFPDRPAAQKTTFSMLLFSGGISWIVLLFTGSASRLTPDLFVPEWNLITASMSSPHFMLGIGFQALFFSSLTRLLTAPTWQEAGKLALIGTALGLSYPFLIAVNGVVITAYFLWATIRTRSIQWKQLEYTAAANLPMIAFLVYYGIILPRDPLWRLSMMESNQIIPPSPVGLAVGFGLLLPLILLAINPTWREPKLFLIPLWFSANFFTIYLPFSFSGRFVLGIFIPACILAAYTLEEILLPKLKSRTLNARKLFVWLTVPSTILFVVWAFLGARSNPNYPYYFRQNEVEAAEWLGTYTTPDDLLLADYPAGSLIPRYADGLVFAGHLNLTIDLAKKQELVHTFFDPDTPQSWRDEFLQRSQVTIIYQGHYENNLSGGVPLELPYPVIYQTDEITIYALP